MKFEILKINKKILQATEEMGFEHCTPVQEQSLPDCIAGADIISQSQTGTGKTAVFLITALNRLISDDLKKGRNPRALILVPTRELATQVSSEADKLGRHLPLRSIAIYGGVDYDKQIRPLNEGVDIIVATPGRLMDLYKSKAFSLESIEIFIIDEADRMFDMGFAPDVRYIAGRLPKDKERQTLLFSATIDYNVKSLASRFMRPDPVLVEIEPESVTVDAIDQKVLYVSNEEKLGVLMGLLKRPDSKKTIIFINMKRTAEMLEWKLKENGFEASMLTGDVSQSKRERIMNSMKAGKVNILIATDVAARGVHIDDVTHVINYDLPDDPANYVHRIGRTARAGKTGKAYSLGCEDSVFNLPAIEEYIERTIEKEWMDEDEIVKDKAGRYRRPRPRTTGPGQAGNRARGSKTSKGPYGRSTSGQKSYTSGAKKTVSKSHSPSSQGKEKTLEQPGSKSASSTPSSASKERPKRPSRPRSRKPADPVNKEDGAETSSKSSTSGRQRTRRPRGSGNANRETANGRRQAGERTERVADSKTKRTDSSRARTAGGKQTSRSTNRGRNTTRGNSTEIKKESGASDARLSFYSEARSLEPSSRKKQGGSKNVAAAPESRVAEVKTEGLIKRVLKSFWKK